MPEAKDLMLKVLRPWRLPAVLVAASWLVLVLLSVPPATAALGVAVVAVQSVSGGVWWALVRRDSIIPMVELVGMGMAIGTLLALLAAQATTILGLGGWGWILPSIAALVVLVLGTSGRVRMCRIGPTGRWGWLAVLSSYALGLLALLPSVRRTPLMNGYVVGGSYHGDLVFLEAVSDSLARFGPGGNLLLSDHGVRYHWFTYAWVGSLTDIVNAEAFVVLTRVLPLMVLVGAVCLAVAWAQRLSAVTWVPAVAAYLVVVAAYVGAAQGVVLTYDSPSAGYAAVLGLAFAMVLIEFLHFRVQRAALVLIALLAAGTVGAKVSEAAVIAAGIALLVVASFWYARPLRRRVWIAAVISAAMMALTYLAFIAGISASDTNVAVSGGEAHASTFQGLDPFTGPLGVILGTVALCLAILPRWIGAAWLLRGRTSRYSPETVFGIGVAVAGLGTLFLLRSGTNAAWFALASSGIIAVLSAVGLGRALGSVDWLRPSVSGIPRWRDPVVWSLGFAFIINGLVLFALALAEVSGAPVLWRGPVLAWVGALILPLFVMHSRALHGPLLRRWAAIATSTLIFTAIVARVGGPIIWDAVQPYATPYVQRFILIFDSSAQFPVADAPPTITGGGVRATSVRAPVEDTRGASDGVARTMSIIQWSPALNEGALWLGSHAAPSDLAAMNDPLREPFLPIMSHVPMYLAGLPYTTGYTTKSGADAIPERRELVTSFLAAPTEDAARTLWNDGVRWLWVQDARGPALDPVSAFTSVGFVNAEVTVLRLNDPGAS